ncbi:hypothetical protein GCM10023235_73750 [Kitasatospora terrestris]|uniref:Uncharacterized protein n=1 Tax=Kitasatospora terrestris TaxID=258051 RepID=A0ABP9EPJ3_9ACTN
MLAVGREHPCPKPVIGSDRCPARGSYRPASGRFRNPLDGKGTGLLQWETAAVGVEGVRR